MGISQLIKTALKGVLLMPLVAIALALLWLIFTILNKAYWDAWVTRMCTSTDLVTVFETVDLRDPAYSSLPLGVTGLPLIPADTTRAAGDPFYVRSTSNIDRRFGGVSTGVSETAIVRAIDGKVLSHQIWYGRSGGDFIDLGSPGSYFSCSELGYDSSELRRATFLN